MGAFALAIISPIARAQTTPRPLPLGTVGASSTSPGDCPSGFGCSGFSVRCPGVRVPAQGFLAKADAFGTPTGVVVFFSGGDGTQFWGNGSDKADALFQSLRHTGLTVFQVSWGSTSWLASSTGEQVGPARLACRPASVIKWIHDNNPISAAPVGRCGFCISGQSAGASQVTFALARYGLDTIVSVMVPSSGPPHADIVEGCTGPVNRPSSFEPKSSGMLMDLSYGFPNGGGPCEQRDANFSARWNADGVDANGDFSYPHTAVRFVFGDQDSNPAQFHAKKYFDRLLAAHSPYVSVEVVHCMTHSVQDSTEGLVAIRRALLGQPAGPERSSAVCSGKTRSPFVSTGQQKTGTSRAGGSKGQPSASPDASAPSGARSVGWPIVAVVAVVTAAATGFGFLSRRRGHA